MLCPLEAKLGPPIMKGMIVPCTNMDEHHRRCFRHPEDDVVVVEVIDEAPDELDAQVVSDEASWAAPDVGEVGEDAAMDAKMAAVDCMENGDLEGAVANYSKALAGAPSALTYAKRADCLLKLGFPTAATADCKQAAELNPDSAKAYKVMAKALKRAGDWDGAFKAICTGNKIDYDEDAYELQKAMAAKMEKQKKIGVQRAAKADAFFSELGLAEAWASLELDVSSRAEFVSGTAPLPALKAWHAAEPVSLTARLAELKVEEADREKLYEKLAAV